jgi:anti-sigma factor ChrR (cupin superfamily)
MSSTLDERRCPWMDQLSGYALTVLPAGEAASMAAHLETCAQCRQELEAMNSTIDALAAWQGELLPSTQLWDRVVERIAIASEERPASSLAHARWIEPAWEEVAPGIACKLLASDPQRDRVSMLVRLAAGIEYPSHEHAGVEELHLLDGELWIDDRKLYPGDYNRAEPGTSDAHVWSETGCTCVLITSPSDVLR